MTPQQEWKQVQRKLRGIPVEAIAPSIDAEERDDAGLWCLVGGALRFVLADGRDCETTWDDPLVYAQYARWVEARPERVHSTHESAVTFVRSRSA